MVEGWNGVDSVVKQHINGAGGGNGNGDDSGDGNVLSSAGNNAGSATVHSGICIRYAIQDVAKEDSEHNSGISRSSSSSSSSGDRMNTMEQDSILQQHFGNSAYCLTSNCDNGNYDNGNYNSGIKRDTTRGRFIIFRNTFPFSQPTASKDDENIPWKA